MDDVEKGKDLIERLISGLNCLPCCWEEIVGEELGDEVKAYLGWEEEDD